MNRLLTRDIARMAYTTTSHHSIPLTPLSSLRLRHPIRHVSTEQHSSSTPPPPAPTTVTTTGDSKQQLTQVPPPGSPAPLPPVRLDTIPPKIVDLAEETAQKEVSKKEATKPQGSLPSRAWAVVKKEAAHYWAGTKLLGHEIKISAKLLRVVLRGEELTRRERRQVRAFLPGATIADK
jgi:LETM1 and EF-hand domain-containing protein 1